MLARGFAARQMASSPAMSALGRVRETGRAIMHQKMKWSEIRNTYPDQWLVVAALEAHTQPDNQRHIERFAVIESCTDGRSAMQMVRRLHRQYPEREFYFIHTGREELNIRERQWLGVRRADAAKAN